MLQSPIFTSETKVEEFVVVAEGSSMTPEAETVQFVLVYIKKLTDNLDITFSFILIVLFYFHDASRW